MLAKDEIEYLDGIWVRRLGEEAGAVRIEGRETPGGAHVTIRARKALVGAGALSTTRIMMASLGLRELRLLDSQMFQVPFVTWREAPIDRRSINTLAHVFIELDAQAYSPYTIHFQVYGYNDFYDILFENIVGVWGARRLAPLLDRVIKRLLIFQGYLHSEHSAELKVRFEPGEGSDSFRVESAARPGTRALIGRLSRFFFRNSARLGGVPLAPWTRVMRVGRGGREEPDLHPRALAAGMAGHAVA